MERYIQFVNIKKEHSKQHSQELTIKLSMRKMKLAPAGVNITLCRLDQETTSGLSLKVDDEKNVIRGCLCTKEAIITVMTSEFISRFRPNCIINNNNLIVNQKNFKGDYKYKLIDMTYCHNVLLFFPDINIST